MRAALKACLLISYVGADIRGGCWWYGSRGWAFPPIFHYMLFLCDRWQQRGRLTKWHLTWKCGWSKGVWLNSSMQKKNGNHWHLLMLLEDLWRTNSGCEHSEEVGGAFQLWEQWVPSTGARFYRQRMQTLVHCCWKCIASAGDCVKKIVLCGWEFSLSNIDIVLCASVAVPMEINRKHYFWSKLC